MIAEPPETLPDILESAWQLLTRGAADRRSPLHTPAVISAGPEGTPDARIMVLRKAVAKAASLRFHTDARSPKCRSLHGQPVAVLGYHPGQKVQLRLQGTARIETQTPETDAAWARSTPFARRCYLTTHAPGTPLAAPASGLPAPIEGQKPSEEQLIPARPNFALLHIEVTRIDWLHLANTGHRRALFEATDSWHGRWLTP
jgi:pyridoxine/pyridoxamine 5'-phosphate oxidase